ncbi:MAG: triose-phosphate isomerase [Oscillospiraceae bacterium]
MDMQKSRTVIAGNWKMNKNPAEAAALLDELASVVADARCAVVVCPPFVDLQLAVEKTRGTRIEVGAQNVHFEPSGAFTGEVSADMLLSIGVQYAIVGHSERRQYFGETDETVNKRARAAIGAGLTAIICVGENLAQREQGITEDLIRLQTRIALMGITEAQMRQVIIAYEPVWAIGTGRTATAQQAEEVCAAIRRLLAELYGQTVADGVTVQYGGSMNAANAEELLDMPNVDGGLIGGASLKPDDFAAIVKAASR